MSMRPSGVQPRPEGCCSTRTISSTLPRRIEREHLLRVLVGEEQSPVVPARPFREREAFEHRAQLSSSCIVLLAVIVFDLEARLHRVRVGADGLRSSSSRPNDSGSAGTTNAANSDAIPQNAMARPMPPTWSES